MYQQLQMDFTFEPSVKIRMKPMQYLFKMGAGSYCLGIFDNQNAGTLIGGISVRNILVQVCLLFLQASECMAFTETPPLMSLSMTDISPPLLMSL